MKPRILTLLLAAGLCLAIIAGFLPGAAAFTDVSDPDLSEAVEVLSSLGILSGYSDGRYRPEEALTRAQFCKLAVLAEGHGDQISASAYRSLFSDVPAGHWAAPYINLAYGEGLVSGYGNGTFGPDDPVTAGQAVTVILHLMGYSNEDIGPFWPEDYMAKGAELGLTGGLPASGQALTRGEAALLLYAMLRGDTAQGEAYAGKLAASTVEGAVLMDNDAQAEDGTLHTAKLYASATGVTWYEQDTPLSDALVGRRGTLLLEKDGTVSGFLPEDNSYRAIAVSGVDAAGITDSNGRTYALSSTTAVVLDDQRQSYGDCWYELENSPTATLYYASSGSVDLVVASDTQKYQGVLLTGYYEDARPNTASPSTITLLGMDLEVADGAVGLSGFSVGDRLTVELDGAGRVVAAYSTSEKRVELVGILEGSGENASVRLANGLTARGTVSASGSVTAGSLVRVNAAGIGKLSAYAVSGYTGSGALNVAAKTLGSLPLSDDVTLYDRVGTSAAVEVALDDILTGTVPASKIEYVGTNAAGAVNVVLLKNVTGNAYTYGVLTTGTVEGGSGDMAYTNQTVSVENSAGLSGPYVTGLSIQHSAMGGIAVNADGKVSDTVSLTRVTGVSRTAFDGTGAVVVDGMRVPVGSDVQVYNTDTGKWTSLSSAKAYTEAFTVYYSGALGTDAVVRVIYTA